MKGGFLGKAVLNGALRYASVSSVKTFDKKTKAGCPRRWWKRYVGGEREPESDNMKEAKEGGISLDTEVKHFLATGEKNLSALAIKGLHILDLPGTVHTDVAIHRAIEPNDPTAAYRKLGLVYTGVPEPARIESALTAGGVPFVGELDILNLTGRFRDDDGQFYDDPPGTVEVSDLKFKSTAKDRYGNSTLMLANDLVRDVQMSGYGEWIGRVRPETTHVRLSHLYFPKKPAGVLPSKVTKLHVLDDCRRTWEYVDGVVRSMVDVAKETDFERVPGADRAMSCDAYGGCPYRESCGEYKRTSLDNLFNKIVDDHNTEKQMGIMANTPGLMQQQLAQEETQMRAQVAQQQQQMPFNPAEFIAVCTRLGTYGFGMPSLAGNAAQAYAAAGGQQVAPGFVFQGIMAPAGAQYSFHSMTLSEVAQVYQLEREAAAKVAPPAPVQNFTQQLGNAYNQVLAQQAQVTTPSAPSQVTNTYTPPPSQYAPGATVAQFGGILPPGAPESIPALAAPPSQNQLAQAQAIVPEAPATAKKGRPKKAPDVAPEAPAAVAAPAVPPTQPASVPAPQGPPVATSPLTTKHDLDETRGSILINARFGDRPTKSLAGYVDYVNETLARRYNVTRDGQQGPLDVRASVEGSKLAFGAWKGFVREIVKADPPPVADYHFDVGRDELNEAVADALRVVAEQKGWLYVRGVQL